MRNIVSPISGFPSPFGRLRSGGSFSPAVLFANNEPGVWFDPSDLTTLFQDTAGTTPVTTAGQTVALMLDKSGNGLNVTQATAAARPTYQVDAGGRGYLSFDGVDDFMVTPTITPGIDKVQVFAGVRKLSDANVQEVLDYSYQSGGGNFFLRNGTVLSGGPVWSFASKGNVVASASVINTVFGFPSPITSVLSLIGEISTNTNIIRANGSVAGTNGGEQGTGNYRAHPMYIGRRGGTTLPFNGQIYSLITRFGANLEVAQIESTEAYVAGKTGVDL